MRLSVRLCCGFVLLSGLLFGGLTACSDSAEGQNGEGAGFILGDSLVLSIEPESVTFADVAVGSTASQQVTLRHLGSQGTLRISDMVIESDSTEFSLEVPAQTTMEPGDSLVFTVVYSPADDVVDSGRVVFNTNISVPGGGTLRPSVPISSLEPYGQIVASPSPLDFGAISSGVTETRTLSMTNIGTLGVEVQSISLNVSGVSDFEILSTPTLPASYDPDTTFSIEVSYTPTQGDVDSVTLIVDYKADTSEQQTRVLLKGSEISPSLSVFPNPIDFGKVAPGESHKLPFGISNNGSQTLEISSLVVDTQSAWSGTVTLEDVPQMPVSVEPSGVPVSLTVVFTPTADMPVLTSPVASVRIDSNDPAGAGTTQIPVFGSPKAPSLQVQPADLVDFGFVAQNQTATRKVTLFNAGTADLTVTQVSTEDGQDAAPGEYGLVNPGNWGPTSDPAQAAVIPGGQNAQVRVGFTNLGGSSGTAWGTLRIISDDPAIPSWEVTLKAERAGAPQCRVQLVPDTVDYGIVPRGFSKTMTFNLVNVGSGACGYLNSFVNDCSGFAGLLTTSCPDPTTTVQTDGTSDHYFITEEPFSAANNLKPGESYPIKVTFTPPDSAPLFGDEFEDYAALLAVRVTHNYTSDGSIETLVFPEATNGTYTPNLHARSGIAELSVFPGEIDFGLITVGCHSQTLTVNAYNVGTAPLDITGFELQGCSPEFDLASYPPLTEPDGNGGFKKVLNPDEGVEFELQYVPQDEGNDTDGDQIPDQGDECALAIFTNGSDTPAAVVPLSGIGTFETEHTDTYIQKSGQDVDVLFVVDSSGSMGEEQSNLSSNFLQFINEAITWSNDYRLAVVTMDVEGDGALFQGNPRVVTPATVNQFGSNVQVGTSGSGTEQGLMAAQLALSLPLISDSQIACTSDGDCTAPDVCVEGFCGGPNRGFLREDASLEVVFVSDEEDQSPAGLAFYENFFKNLKGFYNSNLLHLHAIVGPPGGCSSSNGDAAAGNRYWELAAKTGGNQISICEPDFANGLKTIGEIAFGLKVQFFLARQPEPSTIDVTIDGVPCDSSGGANWTYDAPSNSVVFNEAGACMPQPGEAVSISYETICLLE